MCAIALAAIQFVLVNNVGTLAVLVAVVVVPLASIAALLLQAKSMQAVVEVPASCESGEVVSGNIAIDHAPRVPLCRVGVIVEALNTFLRASDRLSVSLSASKSHGAIPFSLQPECCGRLDVGVVDAFAIDAFGLARKRIARSEALELKVGAPVVPMRVEVSANQNALLEASRYSTVSRGADPSETYALREYIPGDSMRSIHWKLSAKADELIVRELGLPLSNDTVIVIETSLLEDGQMPDPATVNAMISSFLSLSHTLIRAEMAHSLAWTCADDSLMLHTVSSADDVEEAFDKLLASCRMGRSASATTLLCDEYGPGAFSHVVVFAAREVAQASLLAMNGARVTVVVFGEDAASGSGAITMSAMTYREDLSSIEI